MGKYRLLCKCHVHTNDWDRFRKLQVENQKACKNAYNTDVNNMVDEDSGNCKRLYSFNKSKKCDGSGVSPLLCDSVLHSSKNKAEILNTQFSSVFTSDDQAAMLPDLGEAHCEAASDIVVTENGVLILLKNLNPNKASGPDQISSRYLKTMSSPIAPVLTTLFQASINQGHIPDDWKTAYVTPLFKKGDRAKASNYLPVSLTLVCCKIKEHVIHSHVINHLERNNILEDKQHGFRKRRSCESQLITIINDLAKGLNDKKQIDAELLDFSKAFDKVSHRRLTIKLDHYGVRGNTLARIQDFLSCSTQQVVVDGENRHLHP